jgi:hypothetical protein
MSTSLSHGKPDRSLLLSQVLNAHGGLKKWHRVRSLQAETSFGGPFWALLGWPPTGLDLHASLNAHRQHITLGHFAESDQLTVFDVDPERLSIQTTAGTFMERRYHPRSSFPAFDLGTTEWDSVQVAYFLSAALWNYLTQPFSFTYPGVDVREIEPWDEGSEMWRRLAVRFPRTNANHNADQLFYYDADFMLRRMDYAPEVTGYTPVAHYTDDPQMFDGFVFPTRRRVHQRDADGNADQSVATITLDIADITLDIADIAVETAMPNQ